MSDELEMLRKEVAELRATVQHLKDVQDINDVFFKWHFECTGGFKGKQAGREELFTLFPYGYVRQVTKIAGMRQPRAWSTG